MDVRCQFCGHLHVVDDGEVRRRVVHFRCHECKTLHFVTPSGVLQTDRVPPSPARPENDTTHGPARRSPPLLELVDASASAAPPSSGPRERGGPAVRPKLAPVSALPTPPIAPECDGDDVPTVRLFHRELRQRRRWAMLVGLPLGGVAIVACALALSSSHRAIASDERVRLAPLALPPMPALSTAQATPEAAQQVAAEPSSHDLDTAIDRAAHFAARCAAHGSKPGAADVWITVAPSGRVSRVLLSPGAMTASPVGRCITVQFKRVAVAPFGGGPITVLRSIEL